MRQMSNRIIDLFRGLHSNLEFSNGLYITYQRLWRRNARELTYVWRKRLRIVCDCTRRDHFALKEIFVDRIYAPFFDRGAFASDRISYVNIGAHIGAFDLWLREQGFVIEGGVCAELNPLTYQHCVLNLQTNKLVNVCVINCAVAGQDGFFDFFPSHHSLGDNIFPAANAERVPAGSSTRVEVVSLSTFLQRHAAHRDQFDLLKLDCEGAEYAIVRKTPLVVLRQFRRILIEFHAEPAGESVRAAYERLRQAGFGSWRGQPGSFTFMDMFIRS
jgi:FkbM family methyltransferase